MRKIISLPSLLIVMFTFSLFAFTIQVSAVSRSDAQKYLSTYKSKCKRYVKSKHNKDSKQDRECLEVRTVLDIDAGCDFGSADVITSSANLKDCEKKVGKLPATSSTPPIVEVTGGSKKDTDKEKSVDAAEIAKLGGVDPKPVRDAGVDASQNTINSVVNIVFSLAGGLALLFVAIGGLRFILSRGDPQSTAQARNTVLFAVIGLIVTMFAYAIVRFVVGSL